MPPPSKRRITTSESVDEVLFDPDARHEYLTGFHKRKLQRTKQAQETAAKKARAERIADRRKTREVRKKNLARQLRETNALMNVAQKDFVDGELHGYESPEDDSSEWTGVSEASTDPEKEDLGAEYFDEDKSTTVTVQAMDISKNGLYEAEQASACIPNASYSEEYTVFDPTATRFTSSQKPGSQDLDPQIKRPKKKRKSFRYETKAERKATRVKEKMRNSKRARARKDR